MRALGLGDPGDPGDGAGGDAAPDGSPAALHARADARLRDAAPVPGRDRHARVARPRRAAVRDPEQRHPRHARRGGARGRARRRVRARAVGRIDRDLQARPPACTYSPFRRARALARARRVPVVERVGRGGRGALRAAHGVGEPHRAAARGAAGRARSGCCPTSRGCPRCSGSTSADGACRRPSRAAAGRVRTRQGAPARGRRARRAARARARAPAASWPRRPGPTRRSPSIVRAQPAHWPTALVDARTRRRTATARWGSGRSSARDDRARRRASRLPRVRRRRASLRGPPPPARASRRRSRFRSRSRRARLQLRLDQRRSRVPRVRTWCVRARRSRAPRSRPVLGGKGANQSVALARAGAERAPRGARRRGGCRTCWTC